MLWQLRNSCNKQRRSDLLSIICVFFRKETGVFSSSGVKLGLRKEKCFLWKVPDFPRKKQTCLQKQIASLTVGDFSLVQIWQAPKYFVYFKAAK